MRGGWSVHSGVKRQEWLLGLCRRTALHWASLEGHTETAMALAKAGADVHCTDNRGYGSSGLHRRVVGVSQGGADGPCTRGGGAGVAAWLCRWTALHFASVHGHSETAIALAKAGADVHCKNSNGFDSRGESGLQALCATGK